MKKVVPLEEFSFLAKPGVTRTFTLPGKAALASPVKSLKQCLCVALQCLDDKHSVNDLLKSVLSAGAQ